MCSFTALGVGLGLGQIGMSYYAAQQQAAYQQAAYQQQVDAAQQQMNYDLASLENERAKNYDDAFGRIADAAITSAESEGQAQAYIAEEMSMGGQTVDAIYRQLDNESAASINSIQSAYKQTSGEINEAKANTIQNTSNYINGIPVPQDNTTFDTVGALLEAGALGLNVANASMNKSVNRRMSGVGGSRSYSLGSEIQKLIMGN